MAETTPEVREQVSHHQVPQAWALAALVHLGLLAVCASAVLTVQPANFGTRAWGAYGLVALVALLQTAVTRGRAAFSANGKALTALLAGMVLFLSYDPQLSNLPALGERLPQWLSDLSPSLGTVGALWAGFWGLIYLATIHRHHRDRHAVPYLRPVLAAAVLVVVLGLSTFLALHRVYELESGAVQMLVSQALQYGLLLAAMLGLSGRIGFGSVPEVYMSLSVLAALAHNLKGGGGA